MDPKGFLPAHMQTKMQGTTSGPHVTQGGNYGGSSGTSDNSFADPGNLDGSNAAQSGSYDRQAASGYDGATDPTQQHHSKSERRAEEAAGVAATGTAARHEEKRHHHHHHEKEPRGDEYARQEAGDLAGGRHADSTTRREAAEQRELNAKNRGAGNTSDYTSATAGGATGDRNLGQNPYAQQDPASYGRRGEEEALGAGAVAGAGAGALASHHARKDEDPYMGQAVPGRDGRVLPPQDSSYGAQEDGVGGARGVPGNGSYAGEGAAVGGAGAGRSLGGNSSIPGDRSYAGEGAALGSAGAVGSEGQPYGRDGRAPQIGGDPESGFTSGGGLGGAGASGREFDPAVSSTAGQGMGAGQRAQGIGGETGAGLNQSGVGGGAPKEGLFHGHHTTLTGERLDPHISGSGA